MNNKQLLKKIKDNVPNYRNSLSYALVKKDNKAIVEQLNKYINGGKTDIKEILYDELHNRKITGGDNTVGEIMKFKGKKCIIFNSDYMPFDGKMKDNGRQYKIKYLIELLKNNNWKVYINNTTENYKDTEEYIPDINLLIKYSGCNTRNSKLYYESPNIDLTFGGLNDDWVHKYLNKYKIYDYDFNKNNKIPTKRISDYLDKNDFKAIKDYIKKNKNNIEYDKFIIKPIFSWAGKGIFYIKSTDNVNTLNSKFEKKYFPYVIQPLMENTVRFHNRVAHLRCLLLITCFLKKNSTDDFKNYKFKAQLYDKYYIMLAKENSYDSHAETSGTRITFQNNYKEFDQKLDVKQINNEIHDICKKIKKIIKKRFVGDKCNFLYDDMQSVYTILGPDIMITKDGHAKLIEVNYKVGTTFGYEESEEKEAKEFMTFIYNNAIKPME
jgi:hypothetical protein